MTNYCFGSKSKNKIVIINIHNNNIYVDLSNNFNIKSLTIK